MFLVFESVLNSSELKDLRDVLIAENFVSGALTAHGDAKRAKNNLQLPTSSPNYAFCSEVVLGAVKRCSTFMMHTMPVRMTPPLFNLYAEGMCYGQHTDAALMSAGGMPMRTDYSLTLFLSNPDEYEGGELIFNFIENIPVAAKLSAGSLVVYPSNTLHEVRPVVRGARFAAVMWLQSALPFDHQRGVVRALDRVRELLDEARISEAQERLRLTREELVRIFSQP